MSKRLQDNVPNVEMTKQELCKLQGEVIGVRDMRRRNLKQFVEMDGLLYYQWAPKQQPGETVEQLVLPDLFLQVVCKLAHTIPPVGHLGRDKTASRESLNASFVQLSGGLLSPMP